MPPPILRHVHIRGITPFAHAQALQSALVKQFLALKASTSSAPPAPYPTILTFTPTPVYTFGRRDPPSTLSPSLLSSLQRPLLPPLKAPAGDASQVAKIVPTLRGGQTTFHGPGTLVVYPILDLKSPYIRDPQIPIPPREDTAVSPGPQHQDALHPQGLSVREYVDVLEGTTIDVLKQWAIPSFRTENPGVWVSPPLAPDSTYIKNFEDGAEQHGDGGVEPRKIAALGVHLRRNITSFGVALNVFTDLRWFERITACGLEGLGTTSMREVKGAESESWMSNLGDDDVLLGELGRQWAGEFAQRLWGSPYGRKQCVKARVSDLGLDLGSLEDGGYWEKIIKRG